jgi:glycosyltransferase involved in cell wall biosynthesis
MSTYNEDPHWIKESIDSIINQTYKKIEFIIVLDNPQNEQIKCMLEKFSNLDNRIKIIYNSENIGLVKSLNKALLQCQGKYIARMDADDISTRDRLYHQKKYLEENSLDFVFSGVKVINELGEELFESNYMSMSPEKVKNWLGLSNISNHPTWFLKAEVYKRLNGYRDVNYCEDYDFSLRCLSEGFKIGRMDKSILKYRIREGSISKSFGLEQFLNSRGILKLYKMDKLDDDISLLKLLRQSKVYSSEIESKKYAEAYRIGQDAKTLLRERHIVASIIKYLRCISQSKYYFLKQIVIIQQRFLILIRCKTY